MSEQRILRTITQEEYAIFEHLMNEYDPLLTCSDFVTFHRLYSGRVASFLAWSKLVGLEERWGGLTPRQRHLIVLKYNLQGVGAAEDALLLVTGQDPIIKHFKRMDIPALRREAGRRGIDWRNLSRHQLEEAIFQDVAINRAVAETLRPPPETVVPNDRVRIPPL